jgi:hypothetical protein
VLELAVERRACTALRNILKEIPEADAVAN